MSKRKFDSKFDYKFERQCEYRRKRSRLPWDFYHKKIGYILDITEATHKKIKDKRALEQIREQQVISLVTALEVYLRDMFIYIIDEKTIKSDGLLKNLKREWSLFEVIEFHNKLTDREWKQAELLAEAYNFQSLDDVKSAYQELLGVDLFAQLKNYAYTGKDGKKYQLEKDFDVKIKTILELRHALTHDIYFRKKISYDKLIVVYNYLHFFVDIFDLYLQEKYQKNDK